jgi:spermidine synthase
MGSKKYDPLEVTGDNFPKLDTRYYSPEIHRACFVLPPFVKELIK